MRRPLYIPSLFFVKTLEVFLEGERQRQKERERERRNGRKDKRRKQNKYNPSR
jgi:hypothetical protein